MHILPKIRDKVLLYLRCIDKLLMVWKNSEKELIKFLEELNKKHPTIKFDYHYSHEKVNFLDTTIINSGNKLSRILFTKPSDRKAYLHFKRYHPKSTKKGNPLQSSHPPQAYMHGRQRLQKTCRKTTGRLRKQGPKTQQVLGRDRTSGQHGENNSTDLERKSEPEKNATDLNLQPEALESKAGP